MKVKATCVGPYPITLDNGSVLASGWTALVEDSEHLRDLERNYLVAVYDLPVASPVIESPPVSDDEPTINTRSRKAADNTKEI